jgi:hypothetical protein
MIDLAKKTELTAWVKCPLDGADGEEYLLVYRQGRKEPFEYRDYLRDWKGVTKGGEVLPFNEENLLEFISTPEGAQRLVWMLLVACRDFSNFFDVVTLLKNLNQPLSGNSAFQKQPNAVA